MTKHKVLIPLVKGTKNLPDDADFYKQFLKDYDVHVEEVSSAEDYIALLKSDKFSDLAAIWETSATFRFGGFNQFIDHIPSSVKVISFPWVGANAFDGARIREKGITLTNIGDVASRDVADIALLLTLGTFRFSSYLERAFNENEGDIHETRKALGSTEVDENGNPVITEVNQNWTKELTIGGKNLNSPSGKVAGIVGLGAIGKEIALRLNAIGLKISYTKRSPLTDEQKAGLPYEATYYKTFQELIPHVDLLVLAVPHTEETINLINKDTIKLFKKGVRIVNIGRGSAIDEDVLFDALDDGTVNSIGFDVFQHEPKVDKRFIGRSDVTILPHIGSFTADNFRLSAQRVIENIADVLAGGPGINPVN